jgi:hypothetical protein
MTKTTAGGQGGALRRILMADTPFHLLQRYSKFSKAYGVWVFWAIDNLNGPLYAVHTR